MDVEKIMGINFPNIRILGDTSEIEKNGSEDFASKARQNGLDGSVLPFGVGASDSPVILKGYTKYNTKSNLQFQKTHPGVPTWSSVADRPTKRRWMRGHLMEEPIAKIVEDLLQEETGKPVEYVPCKLEFVNTKRPNVLVHMDGFFNIDGELYLAEVKSTMPSFKKDGASNNHDLVSNGIVPEEWAIQIACVQGTIGNDLGLKGTILAVGVGFNPEKDFYHIKIDRDPEFETKVCEACQKFVDDTDEGIEYTDEDDNAPMDLSINNLLRRYSVPQDDDEVKLGKSCAMTFQVLDELEAEKENLKLKEKELTKDIAAELTTIEKRVKDIDKSITDVKNTLLKKVGDATSGVYDDGKVTRVVTLDRGDFSFDAPVKEWLKTTYPSVWKELVSIKPKIKIKIKTTTK